ncbi:MAG: LuxR C-terminal-related transcriptional regulator [Candidatus Obscuribacterales bacterium]|nr:LuxR C-terminal-related transcriptional regulator [Candidatus Obscuribacterales bacterium]
MCLSRETVKIHGRHIMEKLQVSCRTEAAIHGMELGLGNEHPKAPKICASSLNRRSSAQVC